jgi:hypothetical protein
MIANLMSMGYFGGLIQGFWPMLSHMKHTSASSGSFELTVKSICSILIMVICTESVNRR